MSSARAIILFAHGSRDPRWAEPLHELQAAIERQAQAQQTPCVVRQAFLELMQPPLPQVLAELATQFPAATIDVLPMFWADGGHVLNDLPRLIAEAQQRHPGLNVQVLPTLSRWPGLLDWVAHHALGARGG